MPPTANFSKMLNKIIIFGYYKSTASINAIFYCQFINLLMPITNLNHIYIILVSQIGQLIELTTMCDYINYMNTRHS